MRVMGYVCLLSMAVVMMACSAAPRAAMVAAPTLDDMPGLEAQPQQLQDNHFQTDRMGNLGEDELREILDAPVYLDHDPRIGILPVAVAYTPDASLPLVSVPELLGDALEGTGYFEVASEMSTEWPAQRGIAGLRELAARYRADYLLLYRHRFASDSYVNNYAWTYPTLVGIFASPSVTLETAGVLEATLFDVRTGTILFTAYERVRGFEDITPFDEERKMAALKSRLLKTASDSLSGKVVHQVQRLALARPDAEEQMLPASVRTH